MKRIVREIITPQIEVQQLDKVKHYVLAVDTREREILQLVKRPDNVYTFYSLTHPYYPNKKDIRIGMPTGSNFYQCVEDALLKWGHEVHLFAFDNRDEMFWFLHNDLKSYTL